jgi:hypothetical protein
MRAVVGPGGSAAVCFLVEEHAFPGFGQKLSYARFF